MSITLQMKRGTRAQLDALALVGGLNPGEPFLITDESRIAVALTTSTYQAHAKLLEPYAERVEFVSSSVIYRGQAAPGTADSAPLWNIKRLTIGAGSSVRTEWAGGNPLAVNAWDNRASLSYS